MSHKVRPVSFELHYIELSDLDDSELEKLSEDLCIGLSLEEMKMARDYFSKKGRDPTDIELQAIGQAWSEHCCYKSSKPVLKEHIFNIDAPQNICVIKEDAGVVEFDEDHAYVVALESHNHPSAIEPYGGAATGIGGIVRDVVCMGAQPVAFIDPLFFGPLDYKEDLPAGVKHPKYLFSGVVSGIRDYGNRIGIPTAAGMVYFDEGYLGNCLVNVGCVGIAKKSEIINSAVKEPGDIFVLVGGRTGRDGIHGVTFASAELKETSEEESRGAVQLGDPITKEPLIHACLEVNDKGLLNGMKDLGGGGLSCVIGEMALAGGYGAEVVLERVPLKEGGLAPWEIWVSESQERFMLAVGEKNLDEVLYIFKRWDVDATVVGEVIPEKILRIWYHDEKIFEMDIEFLTEGPVCSRSCVKEAGIEKRRYEAKFDEPEDYNKILQSLLSTPNIASKEWIIRQYDHEVRGATVLKPLQGLIAHPTHGDAAVIKPLEHSFKGLALTSDVNPSFLKIDPYRGGASAIDEVCRNLTSVGAIPHSLADCLNFGNPEKADRFNDFNEACKGLGYVAGHLGVPFVSGNVSFYNEAASGSIPPTPTILGVGIVPDIRRSVTSDVKGEGNYLYLIGETKMELGGSAYTKLRKIDCNTVPGVDPSELKRRMDLLLSMIWDGNILTCHDVSDGGIGVTLSEMLIGGDCGADVDISSIRGLRSDIKLFSESNTRWIVEVDNTRTCEFEAAFENGGINVYKLGVTGGGDLLISDGNRRLVEVNMEEIITTWKNPISGYMW